MLKINTKLLLGIIINLVFTIIELVIGSISGSLSLVSDGLCNLADVFSLTVSFIAKLIGRKGPDSKKTFGYGRINILAALLNGFTLSLFAIYIFYRSYIQFGIAEPIESRLVMIVGLFGLIVNGSAAYMFVQDRKDINIRSSFLNMFFDALASAGALITGIVVYFTENIYIDTIISSFIGLLVLVNAFFILSQIINILLESVPKNLDLLEIEKNILTNKAVNSINKLYLWEISSDNIYLVCSLKFEHNLLEESLDQNLNISKKIKYNLSKKFGISNIVIEIKNS